MRYELRPLSIGGILDRGLRIYLEHFWLLLAISLSLSVPVALAYLGLSTILTNPSVAGFALTLIGFTLGGICGVLVQGALVQAVSDAFLGQPATYGRSLRLAIARFWPVLGFSILFGLIVGVGAMFCLLPGLFLTAALIAGTPAVVLERMGPFDAMHRSWNLTENVRLRTFGAVAFSQYAILAFPGQSVQMLLQFVLKVDPLQTAAAVQVTTALVQPYASIVVILLYYDLRVRREAFDLEVLAREIGGARAALAPPPP